MHPSGGRPGYPPGYYGVPQHSAQLRPGYHHMPPGANSPSFQSMTSHWNLPPTPMSHSYHAHPHHTNANAGGGANSKSKYAHLGQYGLNVPQPKPPDKPLLPYMRYSRKMWEELKADGKRVWEVQTVGKLIGQKWREMSEEEKQPYCDEYEAEKLVYNEQIKAYRNSSTYKRWVEAKIQAEAARDASVQSSQYHADYASTPHSTIPRQPNDPRIMLQQQQQQDDEEDQYITKKQTSAMRFHRNHRLMLEIFSQTSIPDTRHVVTKNRLLILKKQVQSLQAHQKKLHDEVLKIDTHFEAKKKKFLSDCEKFRKEQKLIQANPPSTWKKPPSSLAAIDIPEPEGTPKFIRL